MKIVGILVFAVMCGVLAAAVSLGSGGSLWAAMANYFVAGMIATLLGLVLVIWRSLDGARSDGKLTLGDTASAGK